jgi:hypothetical protein
MLFNDIISADKIYQMMYRSMTESHNKKCGFIVDLNIRRVLNTVMEYSLHNKELSIEMGATITNQFKCAFLRMGVKTKQDA